MSLQKFNSLYFNHIILAAFSQSEPQIFLNQDGNFFIPMNFLRQETEEFSHAILHLLRGYPGQETMVGMNGLEIVSPFGDGYFGISMSNRDSWMDIPENRVRFSSLFSRDLKIQWWAFSKEAVTAKIWFSVSKPFQVYFHQLRVALDERVSELDSFEAEWSKDLFAELDMSNFSTFSTASTTDNTLNVERFIATMKSLGMFDIRPKPFDFTGS